MAMESVAVFVLLYMVVVVAVVVVVMVGEGSSPTSCLGRAYYCLAIMPCDIGTWCLRKVCGERSVECLSQLEVNLCEKPNPALQLVYAGVLGGGYWLYVQNVFPLVPGPFVSGYHIVTGTAVVLACFSLLCMCSIAEPGITVTRNNAAWLCQAYSYGREQIPTPKTCYTCEIPRPSRSKHCPVCNRCVTRFDHHCVNIISSVGLKGWINNCVGSHNLRLFILFLASNTFLCFYAVMVGALAVLGDMHQHKVFSTAVVDYQTGEIKQIDRGWDWLLKWMLNRHLPVVTLNIFIGLMGILLAGFLAYHLWLVARNSTTYEQIKLGRRRRMMEEVRQKKGSPAKRQTAWQACMAFLGMDRGSPYDRGVWSNLSECFMPEQMYRQFGSPRSIGNQESKHD